MPKNNKKATEFLNECYELSDLKKTEIYIASLDSRSEYTSDVLAYISGFIHRKLILKEQCVYCAEYLRNSTIKKSSKFIDVVNRGRLTLPLVSIDFIVKISHGILKEIELSHALLKEMFFLCEYLLTISDK